MKTASMTLISIDEESKAFIGGKQCFIRAIPLDANGQPSGTPVDLSVNDTSLGRLTFGQQDGNSPAGLQGLKAGAAVITATARDNTGITATLNVTVQ